MNVFRRFPGGSWHPPKSCLRAVPDQENPRSLSLKSSPDEGTWKSSWSVQAIIPSIGGDIHVSWLTREAEGFLELVLPFPLYSVLAMELKCPGFQNG
uniref:G protein-coupled receptor 19 n=1 Tax=Mus spicilegus TaxID=10103 RepID=A0A8C6GLZ3_MUSSI